MSDFNICREPGMGRPPLRAQDFMANNPEHLELLRRMGVSLIHLKDGRVQLVQHATQVTRRPRKGRPPDCSDTNIRIAFKCMIDKANK